MLESKLFRRLHADPPYQEGENLNRSRIAFALIAILSLLAASIAMSATIYVKTDGNDSNDGLSWDTAKQTVQAAIDGAGFGDQIWVKRGTYVQCITMKSGVALYGGFAGNETSLSQRAWRRNETVLDGNDSDTVVYIEEADESTIIDGFTITNGDGWDGGGIYIYGGAPIIRNNYIAENGAFDGAGLFCEDTCATVTSNLIYLNNAYDGSGGGICCCDGLPTITSNEIVDNNAYEYGGGIFLREFEGTIANNTIVNNSVWYEDGAGVAIVGDCSPIIANNIIYDNDSGIWCGTDESSPVPPTPILICNCVYWNWYYDYSGVEPDISDIQEDPLFVDSEGNLNLRPDSPCINMGNNFFVDEGARDIDNKPRILLGWVDIGADEFKKRWFDMNEDGEDDIIGLNSTGRIWYTTNKSNWISFPGRLIDLTAGDFNGDGSSDLAGLGPDSLIWYICDESGWRKIPGTLAHIVSGDFNGDGYDDIGGAGSDGSIYYTTDKATWIKLSGRTYGAIVGDFNGGGADDLLSLGSDGSISLWTSEEASWTKLTGRLSIIAAGDLDGDGYYDIAGLSSTGKVYYTTDLKTWKAVPGALSKIAIGDFNGDGVDDIAGLNSAGKIYYTTDKTYWHTIPGTLTCLAIGDFNGDYVDDLAGLNSAGKIYFTVDKSTWTQIPGTLSKLYSARPYVSLR
jgi:hypothetical protein